jgi:trk system potassium uptake protein TrkH
LRRSRETARALTRPPRDADGVLALLHVVGESVPLSAIVFEITSALGNVGLSTEISHPDLHWAGKLILIIVMWLGRLEILPVLVLVASLVPPRK